jgi:hypothetical protein
MKYFLDFEFIEGFHKPMFGKRRHYIDMISVGIACDDGRNYYAISSEYNYEDANQWVRENVLLPMYKDKVVGDRRNRISISDFHKHFGERNEQIANDILAFVYPVQFKRLSRGEFYQRTKEYGWPNVIEFYGYFSDYDWVLFCSLFGRMIDLPKGLPMYCIDLKQMMNDRGVDSGHPDCPRLEKEHHAGYDARWNKFVYRWLVKIPVKSTENI